MSRDHKTELDLLDRENSVLMSEILEKEQYGILSRNENRDTQIIYQLAELITSSYKTITVGGYGEGSDLSGRSDSDSMRVLKGFLVLEDNNLPYSGGNEDGVTYISIRRNKQFPGFFKLELSQEQYDKLKKRSCVINSTQNLKQVVSSVIKQGDNLVISSKLLMVNLTLHWLIPPISLNDLEVSGPAVKYKNTDYVHAFEFYRWTKEAKMWKERRRKHDWPSNKVLERLEKEVSCYVVPKGSEASLDFEIEWNLSFVEIERELIWNMNDTQFKCYICLKRLKKTILKTTCGGLEKISTYQVKNIMFWLCEIIPEHEWKTENLFKYVRLGLMKLQICIRLGYNAHYFIPEINLWRNVKLSATEKNTSHNVLTTLIDKQTVVTFLLDFSKFVRYDTRMNKLTILQQLAYIEKYNALLDYGSRCLNETSVEHLYKEMFARFPETKIFFPCMAITKAKIRLWHRLLHMEFICRQPCNKYSLFNFIQSSFSDIVEEMKAGYETDYLTASLNIALVYRYFRRYSDLLKELKPKLLNNTRKLYVGYTGLWYLDLSSTEVKVVNDDVSDLSIDKQNFVIDFFVRQIDSHILPFPLKLQNCITMHNFPTFLKLFPLVLAYFLVFTSEHYLGLKREAEATRRLLISSALCNMVHEFSYFHLYLVGYSYYITGDMKEALDWFVLSSIANPSRYNAAVYHIAIMISKKELRC